MTGAPIRPMTPPAIMLMVLLCACWGLQHVSVKLALPDAPPVAQAAIRSIGAALLVGLYAAWARLPLLPRGALAWPAIGVGMLFAVEFICLYTAIGWTGAARAGVFLVTAPFFVALGSRWLPAAERFSGSQWLGLAVSFAGVVLALQPWAAAAAPLQLAGDLLAIAGGLTWGLTTLAIRLTGLRDAPSESALFYQLLFSAPVLAGASLALGEAPVAFTAVASAAMLYQIAVIATLTYLTWFAMLKRFPAAQLSAMTFMTPVFSMLAGRLALHEPLTAAFAAGAALILAGLLLVSRGK